MSGGDWNVGVYLKGPLADKWEVRNVVVRIKPGQVVRGVCLALVRKRQAAPGERASGAVTGKATAAAK
jgi:hypothetical protein